MHCSSDFHNVAMNSFYIRKSASPDIYKYILLLLKERTSDRETEVGFNSCEQNKTKHFIYSPPPEYQQQFI